MPWPQTDATLYHAQLGHPDKGRAIKGLVVCNSWDLEPLDLLNGLALGCYQPSPEVWLITLLAKKKHKKKTLIFFKNTFSISSQRQGQDKEPKNQKFIHFFSLFKFSLHFITIIHLRKLIYFIIHWFISLRKSLTFLCTRRKVGHWWAVVAIDIRLLPHVKIYFRVAV